MWSYKIQQTLEASASTLAEKGVKVDPMMPVHPTFLYESVWCILGFFMLHFIVTRHRHFRGEVFMLYGFWYGLERMLVEGMRTDSLYIGSTNIRVSQLLSLIIVIVAAFFFIFNMIRYKKDKLPERLRIPEDAPDKNSRLLTTKEEKAAKAEKKAKKEDTGNGSDN
jgi:phosphatidylglycerol:prolipoprotein diacylglycerol transferase